MKFKSKLIIALSLLSVLAVVVVVASIQPYVDTVADRVDYVLPIVATMDNMEMERLLDALETPSVRPTEQYLQVLDRIETALQESFPFWGAADRVLGLDISENIERIRYLIENPEGTIDDLVFEHLLNNYIALPLQPMTSFQVIGALGFAEMVSGINFDYYDQPRPYFDTLVEGEVAYIDFSIVARHDIEQETYLIHNFLSTIDGYSHLILDFRQFLGDTVDYSFVNGIIRPHIHTTFEDTHFAFHTGNTESLHVAVERLHPADSDFLIRAYVFDEMYPRTDPPRRTLTPAADIIEEYNLVYMNPYDLAYFSYGHVLTTYIPPDLHFRSPFAGQIWVLTDSTNLGANPILAKDTGVGIIVSEEPTQHYPRYIDAMLFFPDQYIMIYFNTLYVTDRYGVALFENEITPHFQNRSGLDALETTLELIAEGLYTQ
ncbi:MAG: hypothetical protein FWG63_03860 [Defluviitaleaceae bacterium]|nr:hypothetical protein [Defluviitaleaceae bacterium]